MLTRLSYEVTPETLSEIITLCNDDIFNIFAFVTAFDSCKISWKYRKSIPSKSYNFRWLLVNVKAMVCGQKYVWLFRAAFGFSQTLRRITAIIDIQLQMSMLNSTKFCFEIIYSRKKMYSVFLKKLEIFFKQVSNKIPWRSVIDDVCM